MTDERVSRRRVLASAGIAGILAGCAGVLDGAPSNDADEAATTTSGSGRTRVTRTERRTPTRTENETPQDPSTETREKTPREPTPSVTDLAIDVDTVRQTRAFPITATIENTGTAPFDGDLRFGLDGEEIAVAAVTVPVDATKTVTVETSVLGVGSHRATAVVESEEGGGDTDEVLFDAHRYPADFVGVDGTSLTVGDGTMFFSGAAPNAYIYGFTHPDPHNRRDIMLSGLERIAASVIRLRAFSYSAEHDPLPWRDNEAFFERFDRILADAKRLNMRVVVSIIDGRPAYDLDPAENPYTSVPTFVHHAASADEINDFFETEECITLYKEWVDELLTRENQLTGLEYREDPTIMMWELGNEIEWEEAWKRDTAALTPWIEDVGPYVKEVAGDQLLSTGEHGWPEDRNDFRADHRPDAIDVCTMHWWAGPTHYDLPDDEAFELVEDVIDTAHDDLEKPFFLGEYNWGTPDPDVGPPFTERIEQLNELHTIIEERDVAATALHETNNRELAHGVDGRDRDAVTVYTDVDDGTAEELRRHANVMREKSASSAVPPMPASE